MIVASDVPVAVGEIGHGMTDIAGDWHPMQPYYVLRTATREEWEFAVLNGGGVILHPDHVYPFFYEIAID